VSDGDSRQSACDRANNTMNDSSVSIGDATRAASNSPCPIRGLACRQAGTGLLAASWAHLSPSLPQADSHPGSKKQLSLVSLGINGAMLADIDLMFGRDSDARSVHLECFNTHSEVICSPDLCALDYDAMVQRFVDGSVSPIMRSESCVKPTRGASGQPSRGLKFRGTRPEIRWASWATGDRSRWGTSHFPANRFLLAPQYWRRRK